ncbi:Domain of unknown function DUF927 [uncultured Caudovirales phage]|uniref:DUF927 domain-containing protein n=1 Tax=uncultured Caudovirales phage TaxID=2100421 RepID=A0A6J5R9X0_9CAUD|nr:Domain of unknown function DUF927 [uncultured Caudovirales phage]
MSQFDLLSAVQPTEGWFAVIGIKDKAVVQKFTQDREEVDVIAAEFMAQERNVFFGVAKYNEAGSRKKDNVKALKAFWLDIDCGEAKARVDEKTGRSDGYIDQPTALGELKRFCKLVGLPKPILVNSGRGVHVYWALTEEITREQWEPVADRLRELCNTNELYVDPAVFEVARVLRIPGTLNFKDDPATEVTVLSEGAPVEFGKFKAILGVQDEAPSLVTPPEREISEFAKASQENINKSFAKIMRRSESGNGCQQLWDCYENRATLSESRWFNALSVAKFCTDKDTAIHTLSKGYPDYAPDKTEQKIQHIGGPQGCKEFEKNNAGGCKGCQFKGKITGPIMLGKELAEATDADNTLVEDTNDGTQGKTYTIPKYPKPYARGVKGGIYLVKKDEEAEPVLVYHNDLYVVKRMVDPQEGDVVVMRLHTPCDGIREFTVSNKIVMKRDELGGVLAARGVVCPSKQFTMVIDYVIASINNMQNRGKAEQMRLQFGWADNDSKFIIGDREISADGTYHSPPSSVTKKLAEWMVPTGSLDKWKEVFNLYGRPGLEPNAFAALSAFGSPLLKFLGQSGVIINLINSRSGTGKTTALHMSNSVYGHPRLLCAVKADTLNAKIMRLGLMNNLPFAVDELTNMSAADFSELAYCMSQGRGKDRLKQSTNEMRLNLTSWACVSPCSSNASFYEKMSLGKRNPDGEMMRLIEYKVDYSDAIDPVVAKQMFDHQLIENYGHAGLIYAEWLVKNLEEAKSILLATQAKIDRELKLTQRERIWSAALAANITGGRIAKRLGLIDWDMKAIYLWATNMLADMRDDVAPPISNVSAVIAEFLNRHMQNYVVVKSELDGRTGFEPLPTLEPKGELMVRQEPDTNKMFISIKPFKEDCVKYQINYKETIKELKAKGIMLKMENKRLSKGMQIVTPSVYCMTLDMLHPEFASRTPFTEAENAAGEG